MKDQLESISPEVLGITQLKQPVLLGYLVQVWEKGKVVKDKDFPGTTKGRRSAERFKKGIKKGKPGRKEQAVTITPIYEKEEKE